MKVGDNNRRTYLGIDLGTSSIKLILIDDENRVLAHDTVEYQAESIEDGWREINQGVWFDSMVTGIEHIFAGQDKEQLSGIGVTGQMHTLVILTEDGDFLRPAMLWNDLRTKELIPELREKLTRYPDGEYLSRTISTGSPLANLYWLKKEEPESFGRIGRILIGPDYLVYRLTGVFGTDYCKASTSCLYYIPGRSWSNEVKALLELPDDVYPAVRGCGELVGTVLPELARQLGISPEVKVFAGTGDNAAAALSTGCLGEKEPFISLGTSGVLVMPMDNWGGAYGKRILFSLDGKEFSTLVQGTMQSNGNVIRWWSMQVLQETDFDYLDQEIDLERAKTNEILFFPHLAGEKYLYADPTLRGAFLGLGTECGREDLSYALLEGICFALKELAEKMDMPLPAKHYIKVVGGGTKSSVWMQILSNVLNLEVVNLDGMVGAGYGMAMMAEVCCKANCPAKQDALTNQTLEVSAVFYPQKELVEHCQRKYQKYLRIYEALRSVERDEE